MTGFLFGITVFLFLIVVNFIISMNLWVRYGNDEESKKLLLIPFYGLWLFLQARRNKNQTPPSE